MYKTTQMVWTCTTDGRCSTRRSLPEVIRGLEDNLWKDSEPVVTGHRKATKNTLNTIYDHADDIKRATNSLIIFY